MDEQHERGSFLDPQTGEVAPVPEAPYGYVIDPPPALSMTGVLQDGGNLKIEPMTITVAGGFIRPATKEEAEG